MEHCKVYKKIVVVFTVLSLVLVSFINISAYSRFDLYNADGDYYGFPYLPTDNEYNFIFSTSINLDNFYLMSSNMPLKYYNCNPNNYSFGFHFDYGAIFTFYSLNDNFEWQEISSHPGGGIVYPGEFSNYDYDTFNNQKNFFNLYYTDFNIIHKTFVGDTRTTIFTSADSQNIQYFNSFDEINYEPVPEGWFNEIMDSVSSFVGGILNGLVAPLQGIANALNSMWESIKNIPQLIADKLEYLFVPSDNKFDELKLKFDEKFGFVGQIMDLGSILIDSSYGTGKPDANITLYGSTVTIIDWDLYDKYRVYIHGIVVLLAYIAFLPKLIKKIPSVLRGL